MLPSLGEAASELGDGRTALDPRTGAPLQAASPNGAGLSTEAGSTALPPTGAYLAVDLVAVAVASVVAHLLRFGLEPASLPGPDIPYALIALVALPTWLVVVALAGGYDRRLLGVGPEEYRRVLDGGVHFLAVVAVLHFIFNLVFARGWVGVMIPVAVLLTLLARYLLRQWLYWQRSRGRYRHRVLLVGSANTAVEVGEHLARVPWAGFTVVGVCLDDAQVGQGDVVPLEGLEIAGVRVPVLSTADGFAAAVEACGADTVAVTDGPAARGLVDLIPPTAGLWRRVGVRRRDAGFELLVAPAITDVAGPRTVVRSVAGLPLLHVEEPTFSGPQRLLKDLFDRVGAALGLLLLAPVFAVVAVIGKLDSRGPVLFRQVRVGRDGRRFEMVKFRTMVANAEEMRGELAATGTDDGHGLLFKLRDDPRTTRVGVVLRRWSLDELPQLWNVLRGQMSLVGPRPPLPAEVERYEHEVNRRLLVKPGMTGLWQVSGRSDLHWDEAVRLDLYYVDHWSPVMDLAIILRTFSAVLRGQGAY